uniref:ATP synthase complex subunit 8 n=1 Tax=Allobates insperatus TaxID=248976 RepID=A0A7M3UT22_9NEOB|nr:ATP synthase F0 subunit 8 [Allobates insperatus]
MPQLTGGPWFVILLSSWIILLYFSTSKTSKLTYLTNAYPASLQNTNTPWSWPWL